MKPQPTTIAPEMIDCIREGRLPTADEVARVAGRIWADLKGTRSAFSWGELTEDSSERVLAIRAAHAALAGIPDPE